MSTITSSGSALPGRFPALRHMVGNTPMLAVRFRYCGVPHVIYAKAEHFNMTGSIKDRMAFHVLKRTYGSGAIRPGDAMRRRRVATPASLSRRWAGRSVTRWSFSCPIG